MSNWNSKYKWDFPLRYSGEDVGVNDSGFRMFKSQPYHSLAKEILQNSLDAHNDELPQNKPVKVKFSYVEISRDDIPGADQLARTIDACCKYNEGDDLEQMLLVKEYSDKHLNADGKVPVLKISDFNTIGLTGVTDSESRNTCWHKLVKSFSSTNKPNGASGSQGVGKFAVYNFSKLRTVVYSTLTKDGEKGIQGKTILTTFQDPDDNRKRVHKARFGIPEEEDVLPVTDEHDIPPVYGRQEIGTDIFVLGFEKDENWMEQIAMSVIEFFFVAILKGTIEVDIEDGDKEIHIGKDNLEEKIYFFEEYYKNNHYDDDENFQYTAPLYWKAMTDPSAFHIIDEFKYNGKSMGQFELYLLLDPDVNERRILEMREAGMKIKEDIKFRIQPSFLGVFIATGKKASSSKPDDNISSFLRKCENPSHDVWAADNYTEQKVKARSIINSIHKRILEIINSKIPKNEEPEIKAYGISELLMSQGNGDMANEKDEAFLIADPKPIELMNTKVTDTKKCDISQRSNGRGKNKQDKNKIKEKGKTTGKSRRNNKNGTKKKTVAPIDLKSIKIPFDENSGGYKVVFSTISDISNLQLAFESTGDDGTSESSDIIEAKFNGVQLTLKDDCVIIPSVKADVKNIVEIKLRGNRRERLAAKAYGEL